MRLIDLKLIRRDALASGEIIYFTGKECKSGHIAFRYASCGACLSCSAAVDPSKASAWKAKHYQINKAEHAERGRQWAKQNHEKSREIKKKWRLANKDKIAAMAISRSRKAIGSVSADEVRGIIDLQKGRCAACDRKAKLEMDHIIPVVMGGRSERKNLQGLCRHCNAVKSAKHPIDFNRSLGLLL